MNKVLVTGGAGFIGSHVVRRFLARGDSVEVLDNLSTGCRDNLPPGVPLHVHDVGSVEATSLVRDGGFTVVAHLAGQIDVRASVDDPIRDATTNILGTLNLLEAVRSVETPIRPRVVFASTGGALYGDGVAVPTKEVASINPNSPYGIGKLAAELYLAYYARLWRVQHVVLRFGNVYGPRQTPGEAGVIAIFASRILKNEPLIVFGDGTQTRDYIYVEDVATAFLAAAARNLPPADDVESRAVNIGTGIETSVLDIARALFAVTCTETPITFGPKRPGELQRSLLDPGKAERLLGWRARVSLHEGLAQTVDWMRSEI